MKKIVTLSFLVVATSTVVAAHAENPPVQPIRPIKPTPTVLPTGTIPSLNLPPQIVAVRRSASAGNGPYNDGPLRYEVEVYNRSRSPLATKLRATRQVRTVDTREISPVTVNLAPGQRAWFGVPDTNGLEKACLPTRIFVELEGIEGSRRTIVVTASCSFMATFTGPAGAVAAAPGKVQAGNFRLKYSGPGRPANPEIGINAPPFAMACGGFISGKANVFNGTTRRVRVGLLLDGQSTAYPDAGCRATNTCSDGKHFIDANQTRQLSFGGLYQYRGKVGRLPITIAADDSATPIIQPNVDLTVTRSCSLTFALD